MSPRLLLGLGAALVCALAVNLWVMMRTSAADAPAPSKRAAAAEPEAAPASEPQVASRTPVPIVPRARPITGEHRDEPAPALESSGGSSAAKQDPATARNDAIRRWMNTEIFASEQAVIDCLPKTDAKLDGYVAIPFRVLKKDGKVVVDADPPDASTFTDPTISECMRRATAAMKYDALPDGVQTVSSYRKIVVKNGALVENWLGPHETK